MTAAQCQQSSPPGRQIWRFAPMDADVSCAQSLLEKIRREAVDGLSRLSHGGLEVGGVLFGLHKAESLEILESVPLESEHRRGPSFLLSEADEASLQQILAGSSPGALEPLGIYISHCRRGFSLTEADIDILNRYFPESWQIALILVPDASGAARAGFFVRRPEGEPGFVCAQELSLSVPDRHADDSEPQPRRVITRAASKLQSGSIDHPAVQPATDEPAPEPPPGNVPDQQPVSNQPVQFPESSAPQPTLSDAPVEQPVSVALVTTAQQPPPQPVPVLALELLHPVPVGTPRARPWSRWYFALSLALLFAGALGGLWLRSRMDPYLKPAIHVSDLGSQLRIEWDPVQEAVRGATSAVLEVRDGSQTVRIPVNRGGLDRGAILYTPQSGAIEAHLRFLHLFGPASESVIYFLNPNFVAANPPAPVSPLIDARIPDTPSPGPKQISPAVIRREPEPVQPVRIEQSEPPARSIRTARVFRPPARQPSPRVQNRMTASLPELPEIHASQPLPLALPFANPPVRVPPSPAATRPAPPPLPREGRLIWTGELRKNGVLTLSTAGASEGALNGRLPGFPVRITVQPAELESEGIRIFSSDQARAGVKERPSARNGWNAVVYKWDPKRVSELTVVEPPGPSNDWKRLVIRNGKVNLSVLVVEWLRAGGQ